MKLYAKREGSNEAKNGGIGGNLCAVSRDSGGWGRRRSAGREWKKKVGRITEVKRGR